MKVLILHLPIIPIWLVIFNPPINAQTNSTWKDDLIEISDSCINDEIKRDTIFCPDSLVQKDIDNGLFITWETIPEFPGGEKALVEYFKNNIIYPEQAVKDKIEGMVQVRFTITTEGCIGMLGFMKRVCPDIDNEVIRVVKTLPKFKPATVFTKTDKGWYWKSVTIWYMAGLNFTLSDIPNKRGIIIKPKD